MSASPHSHPQPLRRTRRRQILPAAGLMVSVGRRLLLVALVLLLLWLLVWVSG